MGDLKNSFMFFIFKFDFTYSLTMKQKAPIITIIKFVLPGILLIFNKTHRVDQEK